MEEKWFFLYHMKLDTQKSMQLPINERKWLIEKFIQQKEKENQAIEASKRKARHK